MDVKSFALSGKEYNDPSLCIKAFLCFRDKHKLSYGYISSSATASYRNFKPRATVTAKGLVLDFNIEFEDFEDLRTFVRVCPFDMPETEEQATECYQDILKIIENDG